MKRYILGFILAGALFVPTTSKPVVSKSYITDWIAPTILTVGVVCIICFSWDNSRSVFSQSKTDRVDGSLIVKEREKITLNSPKVAAGRDCANINIEQVPVIKQGGNNDGGASCGYHALKNAIGILTNSPNLFTDQAFIKRQFSLDSGAWRQWVKAQQHDNGDWIHTECYGELIKKAFKDRNITCGWSIVNSEGQAINTEHIGLDIYESLGTLEPTEMYKHAFFVNTATGHTIGQHGHWFVVVMDKKSNGPTTYTVMDSLGYERHADATVRKIIESVHRIKLPKSETSKTKKSKTKMFLLDSVKRLDLTKNKEDKESLRSMIFDVHTTLLDQDAVDGEVTAAMEKVASSL